MSINHLNKSEEKTKLIILRDNIYQAAVNVKGFESDDLNISVIDDEKKVVINTKKKSPGDKKFHQHFTFPEDADMKETKVRLEEEILKILVPKENAPKINKVPLVPVQGETKTSKIGTEIANSASKQMSEKQSPRKK